MGALISCAVTSAAWCCCTASASLLSSCCGNDKPSTVPPSATSGRRRSVLLLLLSIAFAFAFQYGVAPRMIDKTLTNYVIDAWADGCEDLETEALNERCAGNAGAYRAASSATLFFILAAIAVALKPTANREAWPAKYTLFVLLTLATCFIPNEPLFSDVFLQIARVGAVFFILFEQIILIDMAYNWNDSWVGKADTAETEEAGSGNKWLAAILFSCAILYAGAIAGIALLFNYFSGCGTNTAFMSVTLIACVVITAAQLSGEEGSLLTSAVIVAYATFLCYTAVSKNPNEDCNPMVGDEDILGIVLGVGITLISLGWTGWSSTAEDKITGGTDLSESLVDEGHQSESPQEDNKVTGVVTNQNYGTDRDEEAADRAASTTGSGSENAGGLSNSWKLNVILALVCCWYAMALTGWGSIESGGSVYDPDVGRVSMWMIISSQWLVLSLYLWTLVAPRLFPGRDFS